MDCRTARQLLLIQRPGTIDSDADDSRAVEDHLSECAQCQSFATLEQTFEKQLAKAIQNVVVPADLHARLSERLAAERQLRRRRIWKYHPRMAASLAAAILLFVAGGLYVTMRPRPQLDLGACLEAALDQRASSPQTVEKWFHEKHGVWTVAPPNLNYAFLDSYDLIDDPSGRRLPQLIFVHGADRARVLIVSTKDFDLKAALLASSADSGGIKLELRPCPGRSDVAYLIISNTNSLDWLVLEELPAA
jgi:hypothetical protein